MKHIFTSILYNTVEISKFQREQEVNIYQKGYLKWNWNAKCSDKNDSADKILGLCFFFVVLPSAPDLEWTWNSKSAILPRRNIAQPSSAQYPVKTSRVK